MAMVYTRFITLKNGKRLDAHDFGKKVFAFEGKDNYEKRKADQAIKNIKRKIADANNVDTSD